MRSLGRLGVRVYGTKHRGGSPSNLSRFCAGTVPAGDNGRPTGDPTKIVEGLLDAGKRLGRGTVLISGTDEWAIFVAEHAAELAAAFVFPGPPSDLVARLASKQGLFEIAALKQKPFHEGGTAGLGGPRHRKRYPLMMQRKRPHQ